MPMLVGEYVGTPWKVTFLRLVFLVDLHGTSFELLACRGVGTGEFNLFDRNSS